MNLEITEEKTKELLKEVLIDLIQTKKDVFYDVLIEALEEVGLAKAIEEGRKDDFVDEETIFSILDEE